MSELPNPNSQPPAVTPTHEPLAPYTPPYTPPAGPNTGLNKLRRVGTEASNFYQQHLLLICLAIALVSVVIVLLTPSA